MSPHDRSSSCGRRHLDAIFKLIRRGNILQNNGVQTAAASGEGLAAGVIFTIPALIILGVWSEFSYVETTLIAGFGGILGVLFTIPLRRSLIIDQPLQFPEGVATAEVLKAGATGGGGVVLLVIGSVVGAVVKVGSTASAVGRASVGGLHGHPRHSPTIGGTSRLAKGHAFYWRQRIAALLAVAHRRLTSRR